MNIIRLTEGFLSILVSHGGISILTCIGSGVTGRRTVLVWRVRVLDAAKLLLSSMWLGISILTSCSNSGPFDISESKSQDRRIPLSIALRHVYKSTT